MKKNKRLRRFMRNITSFGDGIVALIVVSLITQDPQVILQVFLGLLLIYTLGYIIKIYVFREKPEKDFLHEFFAKPETGSFPSLHVARSTFALGYTLEYLAFPYILIPFLIVLIVAISRVYLKKHYIVDTIFGLIFGVGMYYLFNVLY
jgi:membrane-associated phospholipid phosphatase